MRTHLCPVNGNDAVRLFQRDGEGLWIPQPVGTGKIVAVPERGREELGIQRRRYLKCMNHGYLLGVRNAEAGNPAEFMRLGSAS